MPPEIAAQSELLLDTPGATKTVDNGDAQPAAAQACPVFLDYLFSSLLEV